MKRRRRGDQLLFPTGAICGKQLGAKSSILCIRPRDTKFSSTKKEERKKRKRKKLNEHVLAGQINLLQKFKVENNFDLDEMDES